MYTSHVVTEVPVAWKAIAWCGPLTTIVSARIGFIAVAVHGVSLALMTQKTCCGGEAGVLAGVYLATVGLQVGVDKFARKRNGVSLWREEDI
jgi:hypothetical protein